MPDPLTRPTAVCCMEMQRGVVGDLSTVPTTTEAVARHGLVPRLAGLLDAARTAGVLVVHCTASFRPDGLGSFTTMPMVERLRDAPGHLTVGSDSVQVVPELWDADRDAASERHHGIAPFHGTDLETILRSRRIETVVAVGVSLNRGIFGMAVEAVGRGFSVVVPRDGAVGYPDAHAEGVLEHSLAGIATLSSVDAVTTAWRDAPPPRTID